VSDGDYQVGLRPVESPSVIDAQLDVPRRVTAGAEFEIHATIVNRSTETIAWADAELVVPWAFAVEGGAQRVAEIRPGGRHAVSWRARAAAQLPSSAIRLAVAASLGSGADVREHIEVAEVARPTATSVVP
jgi:hypothetical protein